MLRRDRRKPCLWGTSCLRGLFLQTRASRFLSTLILRKPPALRCRGIRSSPATPSVGPVLAAPLAFLSDLRGSRQEGSHPQLPPASPAEPPTPPLETPPGLRKALAHAPYLGQVFLLRVAGLLSHRLAGSGGASPRERVCARCLRLGGQTRSSSAIRPGGGSAEASRSPAPRGRFANLRRAPGSRGPAGEGAGRGAHGGLGLRGPGRAFALGPRLAELHAALVLAAAAAPGRSGTRTLRPRV